MDCEYVRQHYGVPACIGRRVVVYGKPGVIAQDRGHHIGVNFDADKPGVIRPAHPTSEVQYLDMGPIRQMTKAQQRYQRYLDSDGVFDNFRHFLAYESRREKEGADVAF